MLCLQETKTPDEFFPRDELEKIGFKYQYYRGEKSYNGVAIVSRIEFTDPGYVNWCKKNDTRHIYIKINNKIELHNFYVPAGGDEPDISINPKFEHKISFINEIKDYFTTPSRLRDYNKSIELLSEIKPLTDTFFDQVKVNSENQQLKKNRLELLYLMCKTFDKFTDFSKLDGA